MFLNIPKPSFQEPARKLDKEFQRIAFSFNFAFALFFCSKYSIRDNRIYPNQKKYYFMSFCCFFVMISLSIRRVYNLDLITIGNSIKSLENVLTFILRFFFYIRLVIAFTVLFILEIKHKYNNTSLILEIHTVHKSIDKSFLNYIVWNWISLLSTICLNSCLCCLHYLSFNASNLVLAIPDWFCDLMFTRLDIDLVVATRIISLLKIYLDDWIKKVLIMNEEQENEEQCHKLLQIYQHILKAYKLYKIVFQELVLLQILLSFLHTLTYFDAIFMLLRMAAESEQKNLSLFEALNISFMSVLLIIRNVIFIIIHSIYCERFYITVEEAQTACIQLVKNSNCPSSQRQFCKNILMANRKFSKMSACGLFQIDATLTICLISVIVNYVVMLMQFFFH